MYKDKKLKFKQINDQEIVIILEYEDFKKEGAGFEKKEKVVGQIFTPSGSGKDYVNSIQVCGISEAFDYWGCGLFGKPKVRPNNDFRDYYYNSKGEKIMEQVKDIQLYFDDDTEKCVLPGLDGCDRCFNKDCSCEVKQKTDMMKEEFGSKSPFIVKRTQDIKDLRKVRDKKE